jgi:uncharacterized protein (DUF952 family)
MIYHVVKKSSWDAALQQGFYEADSLVSEGFIHLSTKEQVAAVLQRYYQNQNDLVLLHVEESKLTAELKYELAPSVNEMFPHLFGRLNMEAIEEVTVI